ncbi:MAG: hypothetical protein JW388_1513 [Nitrospira sp.]|nr:hypothetical protein [Nitrospira sp.]
MVPTAGIGTDIVESHQLGIAGEPDREVIGDEGQREGCAVESCDVDRSIVREPPVLPLIESPSRSIVAGFLRRSDINKLEVLVEPKEVYLA